MSDYVGDTIEIEEMPQGCVIHSLTSQDDVVVSSPKDALALIESLVRMLKQDDWWRRYTNGA